MKWYKYSKRSAVLIYKKFLRQIIVVLSTPAIKRSYHVSRPSFPLILDDYNAYYNSMQFFKRALGSSRR